MKTKKEFQILTKVIIILAVNFLLLANNSFSQGMSINTTGAAGDSSALLDLSSSSLGFLIPRMTSAERNSIANPAEGLQIYNLDCHNLEIYNGNTWIALSPIIANVIVSAAPETNVCNGTSVTFTATAINGGTSPIYQWKLNGVGIGTNSNTFTSSTLSYGDKISCEMTSNLACVSGSPAYSDVLTMLVTASPSVANAGTDTSLACGATTIVMTANTPTAGTGAWSVVSGAATINNHSSPTTDVIGLEELGTATLRWTISNPPCISSSDDIEITTYICCPDSLIDSRDGKSYKTVQIGKQCWFKENLNYLSTSSYCYDGYLSNCNTFGRLYIWSSAITACPVGWHLPSDAEWKQLELFLGMDPSVVDNTAYRGTDQGKQLKATTIWTNGSLNNSSGFTAFPGGFRQTNATFSSLNTGGFWWSATDDGINAWRRYLNSYVSSVSRDLFDKGNGYSVRCIRDF